MTIRERIGYLAGVFDYCHQGHINIIKKSIEIVIVDNNEHQPIYEKYRVTHLFHGTDWQKEPYIDFMGRKAIENREINVVMLPHTPNISSSKLRDAEQKDGKNANSTCCES